MDNKGALFIISAPSGTGKTSLVRAACTQLPNIKKSRSHTTRDMRPGEIDGEHYNFVTTQEFARMVEADVFLEHAEVFGNHYGTSRDWVNNTLQQGTDVILEIDWQGAQQVRSRFPDAISIFILPPSTSILRERLFNRNQDDHTKITARLEEAKVEVSHYTEYDYLIVNDNFDKALQQLAAILTAAKLVVARQGNNWQELIFHLCNP